MNSIVIHRNGSQDDEAPTKVSVCTLKSGLEPKDVRQDVEETIRAHCCVEKDLPLRVCIKVGDGEWAPASLGVVLQALNGEEQVSIKHVPPITQEPSNSEPTTPAVRIKRETYQEAKDFSSAHKKQVSGVKRETDEGGESEGFFGRKKRKPNNYPQVAVLSALKRECLSVGYREYVDQNGVKAKCFLRKEVRNPLCIVLCPIHLYRFIFALACIKVCMYLK